MGLTSLPPPPSSTKTGEMLLAGWATLFRRLGAWPRQGTPIAGPPRGVSANSGDPSSKSNGGVKEAARRGLQSQEGQVHTPHEPRSRPGRGTRHYPRMPPRICRGPVWRAPRLLQTLIPLSPGTPPSPPPSPTRLQPQGSPYRRPQARRSAPPEAPHSPGAAHVSAGVR